MPTLAIEDIREGLAACSNASEQARGLIRVALESTLPADHQVSIVRTERVRLAALARVRDHLEQEYRRALARDARQRRHQEEQPKPKPKKATR